LIVLPVVKLCWYKYSIQVNDVLASTVCYNIDCGYSNQVVRYSYCNTEH